MFTAALANGGAGFTNGTVSEDHGPRRVVTNVLAVGSLLLLSFTPTIYPLIAHSAGNLSLVLKTAAFPSMMPSVSPNWGYPNGQSCSTLLHTTWFLYCNLNSTHRHQRDESSAGTTWLHFQRTASVSPEFWKVLHLLQCQGVLEESPRLTQPLTLPCPTLPLQDLTKGVCVASPKILKTSMEWHIKHLSRQ